MKRIAPLALAAALAAVTWAPGPAAAQPQPVQLVQATGEPEPLVESKPRVRPQPRAEPRPQARPRPRASSRPTARARTQIRVYSRYPYRRYHSVYPLPDLNVPAPRAVRHCENQYEIDFRPSGGVVVPRTRCWWVPG